VIAVFAEFAMLDATALAALVRDKQVSPLELVDASIARIEQLNPQLNAVIHTAFVEARARAASEALPVGPFRGVPTLMKDISGYQANQPHHAGSRLLKAANYVHPVNSYFVDRLLGAGLIPLGRTNVPEFAQVATTEPEAYGATHNPWNSAYSPGGSSGGSAAAVAAGFVPVAHGSDGGGSLRGPASMCGLVGLKPTRGRCSFGPAAGDGWSGLACEFMLTRSVRDAAALLDVLAGAMPGDPYTAPPPARPFALELGASCAPLRVGVLRETLNDIPLHPECLAAVDRMARVIDGLGHHVEQAHPRALEEPESNGLFTAIAVANLASALSRWGEKLGKQVTADDVEPLTWMIAEYGHKMPATQLLGIFERVHALSRRLASWFSEFDLLLTPTTAAPPPTLGTLTSTPEEPLRAALRSRPYSVFLYPWNLSGQPALSLPGHMTASGLPIGVQLVAASAREDLLFRIAAQIEIAAPWSHLRPPLSSIEP
jgi:amidase